MIDVMTQIILAAADGERSPYDMTPQSGDKTYLIYKIFEYLLAYGIPVAMGICGLVLTGMLVYLLINRFDNTVKFFGTGMIMTYLVCVIWYFKLYFGMLNDGAGNKEGYSEVPAFVSLLIVAVPIFLPTIFRFLIPPFVFGFTYLLIMVVF